MMKAERISLKIVTGISVFVLVLTAGVLPALGAPPLVSSAEDSAEEIAAGQSETASRDATDSEVSSFVVEDESRAARDAAVAGPRLSLGEALAMALQNNLGLQTARYGPRIAEEGVREAEGIFNPSFDMSYNHVHTRSDLGATQSLFLGGAGGIRPVYWQHQDIYSGGFQKLFATGTVARFQVDTVRAKDLFSTGGALHPSYQSEAALSLTQPLLQGVGDSVVSGGVYRAEAQREAQISAFQGTAEDLVYQTEAAYWNLAVARENYEIALETEELTAILLEEVAAKIELGVSAPVDRIQVEAQAAQRHQNVIDARLAVEDAEDALRLLLGIPQTQWDAASFTTENVPDQFNVPDDLEGALAAAYANRKDLRELGHTIQSQRLQVILAEDRSRPELNVVGSIGTNGLDNDLGGSLDRMGADRYRWSAGLTFAVPFGYSSGKARAEQARLGLEQLRSGEEDLRQGIYNEIRSNLRGVHSAKETLAVARVGLNLYTTQLEVERERFRLGLSTTKNVLDYNEDYRAARLRELQARINLVNTVINFERSKGTLLEYHGLETPRD